METNELLELLVAAEVRNLATVLRVAASRAAHPRDSDAQMEFTREHPVLEFCPAALKELQAIRDAIKT